MPEELGSASFGVDADVSEFERKLAEARAEAKAFAEGTDRDLTKLQGSVARLNTSFGGLNAQLNGMSDAGARRWKTDAGGLGVVTRAAQGVNAEISRLNAQLDMVSRDRSWGQRLTDTFRRTSVSVDDLNGRLDATRGRLINLRAEAQKQVRMGLHDEAQATITTMKSLGGEIDAIRQKAERLGYIESGGGGGYISGLSAGGGGRGGGRLGYAVGSGGGGGGGYPLGRLIWGGGGRRIGWGPFGIGLGGVNLLHMLGIGPEHLLGVGAGVLGSAAGGVAGGGLLGLGALGSMAVGGGSDLAVMKSTITDTKTLYQAMQRLDQAVATYGPHSKAAAQAQAQLNYQLKALGPGAKSELALAKQVDALNSMWDKVTAGARGVATKILGQVVSLGQSYVGKVAAAAKRNLSIINTGIKPLFAWLKGPEGMKIWNDLENHFAKDLPMSVHAFSQAVELLLKVVDYANSQLTGKFIRNLNHYFTMWNEAFGKGGKHDLQPKVKHLIDDFRLWSDLIKNLSLDLYRLFHAGANEGGVFVQWLDGVLKKWGIWEQSVKGQDFLKTFFYNRTQEMKAFLGLIGAIARPLAAVYASVQPLVPVVTTILNLIGGIINKIVDLGKHGNDVFRGLTIAMGAFVVSWKAVGLTTTISGLKSLANLLTGGRLGARQAANGAAQASGQGSGGFVNRLLGSGDTAGQVWGARNNPYRPGSLLNPIAVLVVDGASVPGAGLGSAGAVSTEKAAATAGTDAAAVATDVGGGAAATAGLAKVLGVGKLAIGGAFRAVAIGGAIYMTSDLAASLLRPVIGKTGSNIISGAGKGAAIGASIGSVIPGVGTGIFATLGGILGGASAIGGIVPPRPLVGSRGLGMDHASRLNQNFVDQNSLNALKTLDAEIQSVGGHLGKLSPQQLLAVEAAAKGLAADPSLSKYVSQLTQIATTSEQALVGKAAPAFKKTASVAGQSLTNIVNAVNQGTTTIKNVLPAGSAAANKAMADNFALGAGDVVTSMRKGVIGVQQGISEIAKLLGAALKTLGVPSTLATSLGKGAATGNAAASINVGAILASGGLGFGTGSGNVAGGLATGGRVPGPVTGDTWTLLDPAGRPRGRVGGGELLIANRHTEAALSLATMMVFGKTAGQMVAGETRPHAAPGYATGGYVDPIPGYTIGRTDMGVDASGRPGAPILAMGDSRLTGIIPNWFKGQPLLDFQLLNGPDAGKYWYVAEQISPVTRSIGARFKAGQMIGRYAGSGTGLELGWAANASGQTLAQRTTGYTEGQITPAGAAFRTFLSGLAAGHLIAGGPLGGALGGIGAVPSIARPKWHGPGGVLGQIGNSVLGSVTNAANSLLSTSGGGGGISTAGLSGNLVNLVRQISQRQGWNSGDWLKVIQKESNGSMTARNPSSGAYGIAQFINGPGEYAQYGGNVNTLLGQITAMANYIKGQYGSPTAAWAHEQAFNWYATGGRLSASLGNIGRAGLGPGVRGLTKTPPGLAGLLAPFKEFNNISSLISVGNPYDVWAQDLGNQYGLLSTILGMTNPDGSTNYFLSGTNGPPSDLALVNPPPPDLPGIDGLRWPQFGDHTLTYDAETMNQNVLLAVYNLKASVWKLTLQNIARAIAERVHRMGMIKRYMQGEYARMTTIKRTLNALRSKELTNRLAAAVSATRRGDRLAAARNLLAYYEGLKSTWNQGKRERLAGIRRSEANLSALIFTEEAKGPGANVNLLASYNRQMANLRKQDATEGAQASPWENQIRQERHAIRNIENHRPDRITPALEAIQKFNLDEDLSQIRSTMDVLGGSTTRVGTGGFYGQLNTQVGKLQSAQITMGPDLDDLVSNLIPNLQLNLRSIAEAKTVAGFGGGSKPTSSALDTAGIISAQQDIIQQLSNTLAIRNLQAPIVGSFAVGTTNVPQTGLAQVHQGEAIIPKEFNPFTKLSVNSPQMAQVHVHGLGDFVDRVEMVVDGKRSEITNWVAHDTARGVRARRLLPDTTPGHHGRPGLYPASSRTA